MRTATATRHDVDLDVLPALPAVMTLHLEGEIDGEAIENIVEALKRWVRSGTLNIVIDLGGVTHLDYRGVQNLVARADLIRAAGGDVKLSGMTPYIHAIFRAAGAGNAFDVFEDALVAQASFIGS